MYPRKFDLTDTLAANKNNDLHEKNRNSRNNMWIAAVTGSTRARVHNRERDRARSCTIAFRAFNPGLIGMRVLDAFGGNGKHACMAHYVIHRFRQAFPIH